MKKIVLRTGITFLVIMGLIMLLSLLFLPKIGSKLVDFIDLYGYLAVFLVSFGTDVVMQPIGPDIAIIAGLVNNLSFSLTIFFVSLGSIIGSSISYFIAKKYGELEFSDYNKSYEKWKRFYCKYDKWSLFLGAITPIPYTAMCWTAGIFKMKIKTFVFFGIIPRILRFITVGYIVILVMMV